MSTDTSLVVVDFNSSISILCTTTVSVEYEWVKVDQTSGETVSIIPGQILSVSFSSNNTDQAGYYYCRATMSPSLINVSDVILVVFAPTFVEHSSSELTSADDMIQLQCTAVGFPQPVIEWIRLDTNNNTVDLPMNSNVTMDGSTSILTIDPVESDDFGSYRCITSPPSILPGNLSVILGFNVSLDSGPGGSGSGVGSLEPVTPELGSDLTASSLENLTASSDIALLTGEPLVCIMHHFLSLSLLQYLLLPY